MPELVPHVLADRAEGVLTLTIDRPEKKNALTRDMYLALAEALNAVNKEPEIAVVVLRGAGGVFTAGNDLRDFQARAANPDDKEPSGGMLLLQALSSCEAVLVGSVSGLAIGIGTTGLLHCDFVYAGRSARFRTPFVDLGLSVEGASSLLLPQIIGYRAAAEMLLECQEIDADRAKQLGLVNAVFPDVDLEANVAEEARCLAAKPRTALRTAKRMLLEAKRPAVAAAIDREYVAFADCLRSPEAQAIFQKFFEKTPE
ncbi:MAG: enoyl-CoA hydratase-related protein [Kiloniellales bacterium]